MVVYNVPFGKLQWNLVRTRMENQMNAKARQATKIPTHTRLVYEELCHCQEDFLTAQMLVQRTGSNYNQVSAALHSLRKHQAVDVVVEADGTGWWFATPGSDQRTRVLDERSPEEPGTRRRRRAKITALPVKKED